MTFHNRDTCAMHLDPARARALDRKYRIRNDYLRFLYAAFLLEFAPGVVREFFDAHPLEMDGRVLSGGDLLRHIWDENAVAPFRYVLSLLNDVESFLVRQGLEALPFFSRYLRSMSGGVVFTPKFVLWAFRPLFAILLRSGDMRGVLLRQIRHINRRVRPGTEQVPLRIWTANGVRHGIMAFYAAEGPDADFLPHVDGELFFALNFMHSPMRFGKQPYDGYRMIAERQGVEQRLGGAPMEVTAEGELRIEGRRYGTRMPFTEFMRRQGLKIPAPIAHPGRDALVMECDWRCPVRNRVVLHRGCAYGAPLYVYELFYHLGRPKPPAALLAGVMEDNFHPQRLLWARAEERHHQLLALIGDSALEFRYDPAQEVLTCNGRFVAKDTNARFLLRLLELYQQRGSGLFLRRDLLHDPVLTPDRNRPALELRIERVQKALAERCPRVKLTRNGRGTYQFAVDGQARIMRQ